ncbi:hypothetical protein [Nonomuraea salmonea]
MIAWRIMERAGVEMKSVRSRAAKAAELIRLIRDVGLPGRPDTAFPASQEARIDDWLAKLATVAELLESVDIDAWKPEILAEIEQ